MSRLSNLILKMTEYEDGCVERVNHFMKVYAFAKAIAEGEGIDDETLPILEAATIVHDIGIRTCFEKYGNCSGKLQEAEGPGVAMGMLPYCGYTPAQCDRICWLIAHHHTYTDIHDIDHQVLVEADFLVNIFEGNMEKEAVLQVKKNIFKTETGKKLLCDLFL